MNRRKPGDGIGRSCASNESQKTPRLRKPAKAPLDSGLLLLAYRAVAFESRTPRFRGSACEMFSPLRKAMLEALSVRGGYRHRLPKLAGRHPLAILSSAIFALCARRMPTSKAPLDTGFRLLAYRAIAFEPRNPRFRGFGVLDVFAVAKGDARGALGARWIPSSPVKACRATPARHFVVGDLRTRSRGGCRP